MLPAAGEEAMMLIDPDGRLRIPMMRNYLELTQDFAGQLLEVVDEVEKLDARADKQPPAQLFLMPSRKDLVQ
jgi:hypothetical protein